MTMNDARAGRHHEPEGAAHRGDHAPHPEAPRRWGQLVTSLRRASDPHYPALIKDLSGLLETARRSSARAVNALMTATYWEIGRRIIEFEQPGATRAEYGAALLEKLSADLTRRFGGAFSRPKKLQLSLSGVYLRFPLKQIRSTASSELRSGIPPTIRSTASSNSEAAIRESQRGPGRRIPSALVALRLAHRPRPLERSTGLLSHRSPAGWLARSVRHEEHLIQGASRRGTAGACKPSRSRPGPGATLDGRFDRVVSSRWTEQGEPGVAAQGEARRRMRTDEESKGATHGRR